MLTREPRPEEKPVPCACCGQHASTCVWQLDLCAGCLARWKVEVLPPAGFFAYPPLPPGESRAQWEAATSAWLRQAKARAA